MELSRMNSSLYTKRRHIIEIMDDIKRKGKSVFYFANGHWNEGKITKKRNKFTTV